MKCLSLTVTFLAVVILTAVCFQPAFAQSDTAQISGFVKDPSGSTVPGASIRVRNEATGVERRATSNEAGYYVVTNLPPGFYTVTVEATGFKRFVKTQNKLDASLPLTVDATLEVGAVTETIEVVASAAGIQSETATVGRLVESSQIQNMMLNGRNPVWLALLKSGVRSGASMATFNFTMTTPLNINGGRTQDFLMTYDGAVAVRTRANGTSIGVADVDTVQEMQILTANYNAEYGRSGSGQVRIVTKSGSSEFHGSAYEYFRNDKLDANEWARNRAGQERLARKFNQFGYNFSGPVFIPGKWNTDRNKLFFLWSQEWVRFRQEQTSIITVPSLAMRRGDFSELLDPANPFFSSVRVVRDPDTGMPFANNVIPASRLSPNGLGLLNAAPEPTPGFLLGRNNFIQTRPNPQNQRKDTISIDFSPTETHAFRFRHQNFNWTAVDAFRAGTDRAVTDWDRPNKTASLNYVWTISPTFINEFLATASVDRVFINVFQEGGRFRRSIYGIDYPYLFPERKEIFDKIPTIDIANFQVIDGGPYPAFSSGPIYVFSNNMTKIFGSHTFKWGVSYERSGQNDFDQINVAGVPGGTNNQNGRFVFTDQRAGAPTSGLAIANAAMGLFDTYAEIGQRAFTPYRANMFEWFVQDSWKVTPQLRLELGLRHTYMTPYYFSLWGNMATFDPRRYNPANAVVQDPVTGFIISGDRYNGVVIPGTGWPDAARGRVAIADDRSFDRLFSGGERFPARRQWRNFQPRFGIAYSPNSKNVVRAGFGVFTARPGVSDNIFLGGNPPIQPMVSIANGQVDNPAGGRPSNFPFFFMMIDPEFMIPNAYQWNVSYERDIGFDTTVNIGYVGRVGLHLERERNINPLQPGTLQRPENAGINPNVLRPFRGYSIIALGENAARSEYNALQLEVNRRFSRGLSYGFAYTLSKSFDNASGRRDRIWNPFDDRIFWGPSAFDTRHVAVINFIYELPFLRNRSTALAKAFGGWQVTGIAQFQTGAPFTAGTVDDFAGIGAIGEFQPWNMLGDPKLPRGERRFSEGVGDQNFFFRTRLPDGSPMFTIPQPGTFTTSQTRNLLNHPGFQNWNLAVFKNFGITERQNVQFRAEFFNFPNHPNWSGADTNPRSGTFGRVTSKTSERNVQLSLRYSF
jgi:hypothetical protein